MQIRPAIRAVALKVFLAVLFGAALPAHARILPSCAGAGCTLRDLFQLLVNIYNFALGLAALVAMLFIIVGAVKMFYWMYMENADQELAGAKQAVTRAIFGLVIVLLAYLIVNTLIVLLGGDGIAKIMQPLQ